MKLFLNLRRNACSCICMILIVLPIIVLTSPHELIAKMDDEIDELIEDEEDAGSFLDKDWNWAPVPTIISNPTL